MTNLRHPDAPSFHGLTARCEWDAVERALLRSGVVAEDSRSQKGRPREALHGSFLPEMIMAGLVRGRPDTPDQVARFWDLLES